MKTHNKFTHLDLSRIKTYTPGGFAFLEMLSESACLEVLNLPWNSLSGFRIGIALNHILGSPLLKELHLSNNMLKAEAIRNMTVVLTKASNLTFLNLSYNPMSPSDSFNVLNKVGETISKVGTLLMDNVHVTEDFLSLLAEIKRNKS